MLQDEKNKSILCVMKIKVIIFLHLLSKTNTVYALKIRNALITIEIDKSLKGPAFIKREHDAELMISLERQLFKSALLIGVEYQYGYLEKPNFATHVVAVNSTLHLGFSPISRSYFIKSSYGKVFFNSPKPVSNTFKINIGKRALLSKKHRLTYNPSVFYQDWSDKDYINSEYGVKFLSFSKAF